MVIGVAIDRCEIDRSGEKREYTSYLQYGYGMV